MVLVFCALSLSLFAHVLGSNIETRIHQLITPIGITGIEFGTSMATSESTGTLVIGSPKQLYRSLYSCPYAFTTKKITTIQCDTFLNNENNTGLGTSLTKVTPGDSFVACSNQYMFTCPNRTIEQRMVGECRSVSARKDSTYKLLTPCPTGCPQGLVADIVFLMDASGSVRETNFYIGLNWIIQVLQQFRYDIDKRNIQGGYVLFNNAVYVSERPRSRLFYDLKGSIEGITNYPGGGTATHKAIDEGAKILKESNRKVPKVMITITDGESNDRARTITSAYKAREVDGIIMIAVGVGAANKQELGRIANGNSFSSERVMTVSSYDKLGDILDELSQVIKESASTTLEGVSSNATTELTNCQFGTSAFVSSDGVFLGAPGSYDRVGTVADFMLTGFPRVASSEHLNDLQLAEITGDNVRQLKDAYFGYSVGAGKFEGGNTVWVVSGMPRYASRGAVLTYKRYDPKNFAFLVHPPSPSMYWQLGGYYGHTVLVMDVNKDGYDDLLVAEPLYSETQGYDEGLVFVYMSDKTSSYASSWVAQGYKPTLLLGSRISNSRFGMTIVNAGDLDRNGYNDVIIGAPNEKDNIKDESSGAVYIYYSSQSGLNPERYQRILGKTLGASVTLKAFGWSIQGGMDVDRNSYPDVAVSAPSSDSVVLMRARKLIVPTLTLTVNPTVIDVAACIQSVGNCVTINACLTAQFRDAATSATFSMTHSITADSLVQNSIYRRLMFQSTKTDFVAAADISVGRARVCNTYGIRLNVKTLGNVNSGGFETTPRIEFRADLAPTHKNRVMSGILTGSNVKTADLSFRTGCVGEKCYHDLQIAANYSIAKSATPLRLDGSSRIFTVNCTISNNGPNNAFFLKVNISSGNLTVNQIISSCVEISEDESDRERGDTVLKYHSVTSRGFQDTMLSGSTCDFTIDFDFTRIQLLAREPEIKVLGKIYSNAGSKVAIEQDVNNNEFSYRIPVQYEANLILRAVSEPTSVFFQPPVDTSVKSIKTLEDKILGGKVSNFFHRYTVYNVGPLGLGFPRIEIQWPEKTIQGSDLIYLVNAYCEDESGQLSKICNCHNQTTANKYNIASSEVQSYFKEFVITYPKSSERITSSDKLTCQNSQCNTIHCDIDFIDKFQQITVVAAFKPWTPTFDKQFVDAVMETTMKIIPSNTTALPIFDTASVTSSLSSYDPENPPPQPTSNALNIGAMVGGILGGLLLLAIAIAVMWKFGFFKSKYGTMTREAKKSIRESRRIEEQDDLQDNSARMKSYGSTVDLIDD